MVERISTLKESMIANKISVVVPVCNAEKYIEDCIRSVTVQTYTARELILVDDGSTDQSGAICDKVAADDDRIKVIHQENTGATRARANGVFSSRGEYVYFLDADDTIESDTLEYMLSLFHDDFDLVVSNCKRNTVLSWEEYVETLLGHGLWYACMKLYRRKLFDEYVFDTPRYFRTGEDFLMQLRTLKNIKGRIACDTALKYHYREVTTSASRAFVPTMEYEISMMQQVNEIISSLPFSERLLRANLKFQLTWLGGMIGFQYPIPYKDKWVVDLVEESKKYKLSVWEKIAVKSVTIPVFRYILIAEKKLRKFYRNYIRKQ